MDPASSRQVTEAEVAAFRRDGAVCLRAAFAPEWIARLSAGPATPWTAKPSPRSGRAPIGHNGGPDRVGD